jgi:hypothetical protein
MTFQDRAILFSRARRRAQLAPLHAEIGAAIDRLGWRTGRPIVEDTLDLHCSRRHGAWWQKVGQRNGTRLLEALERAQARTLPAQLPLWQEKVS